MTQSTQYDGHVGFQASGLLPFVATKAMRMTLSKVNTITFGGETKEPNHANAAMASNAFQLKSWASFEPGIQPPNASPRKMMKTSGSINKPIT